MRLRCKSLKIKQKFSWTFLRTQRIRGGEKKQIVKNQQWVVGEVNHKSRHLYTIEKFVIVRVTVWWRCHLDYNSIHCSVEHCTKSMKFHKLLWHVVNCCEGDANNYLVCGWHLVFHRDFIKIVPEIALSVGYYLSSNRSMGG